ncbi:aldo/keto reductase [bacterium]|nr:aldo/keto reductase [bacterium]
MKRRDFILKTAAGTLGAGLAGCGSGAPRTMLIKKDDIRYSDYSFKATVPRPSGGSIPAGELGTTGIRVSKFGFGSHMRSDIVKFFDERQQIIREAYDCGINLFDVYDKEHECYQYEPMGKHLAPMIKNVVISIAVLPYENRTLEQEFERDLKLFGRDHIDLVRIHAYDPSQPGWEYWEKCFRLKEKGAIRAVGVPVHYLSDLDSVLSSFPLDFVLFPYNYYHNTAWLGHSVEGKSADFEPLPEKLRKKGIGVMTMKAFAGDPLQPPLRHVADSIKKHPELNYNQAALRYVINSPVRPDATVTGMYNLDHLYLNVDAYLRPQMSAEERELLEKVRNVARLSAKAWLPDHYRFLEEWASETTDLGEISV